MSDIIDTENAFMESVWEALKADASDLGKQKRILEAFRAALQIAPDLTDPVTVHANMLRGTIGKPSLEQIIHLYGVSALCWALVPEIMREGDVAAPERQSVLATREKFDADVGPRVQAEYEAAIRQAADRVFDLGFNAAGAVHAREAQTAVLALIPTFDTNQKGGDASETDSGHRHIDTSPGVIAGATTAPVDVSPEALLFAAKTLRSWTEWDATVKPAQAVVAIHSAADLLEAVAAVPPDAPTETALQHRPRRKMTVHDLRMKVYHLVQRQSVAQPSAIAAALAVHEVANLVMALQRLLPQNLGHLPDHLPDSAVFPVDMTAGEIRVALAALSEFLDG